MRDGEWRLLVGELSSDKTFPRSAGEEGDGSLLAGRVVSRSGGRAIKVRGTADPEVEAQSVRCIPCFSRLLPAKHAPSELVIVPGETSFDTTTAVHYTLSCTPSLVPRGTTNPHPSTAYTYIHTYIHPARPF